MKPITHPTRSGWKLCFTLVLSPLLALLLASLLNLAAPAQDADAKLIRLPQDYHCTSDGLHAALDAAAPGDEIVNGCDRFLVTSTVVITKDNLTFTREFSLTLGIIDGGGTTRVFSITSGTHFTVTGVIITNSISLGPGGAIFNEGDLTLIDVSLSHNSSNSNGGAIYNGGTLTALCTQQPAAQALASARPLDVITDLCSWDSNQGAMGGALYNVTSAFSRTAGYRVWSNNVTGDGAAPKL